MPLVDINDPTLYDAGATSLYGDGATYGLSRERYLSAWYSDGEKLIAALESKGMAPGQRIALVGAQFGWLAELLLELGYGPMADGTANGKIAAIDTSTYFQDAARKAANATVTIQNNDINGNTGRRAVKQSFGSANATIDWCVTHLLTMLVGVGPTPGGNNEIVPFCQSCRALSTNVAHWVTPLMSGPPGQDSRLNWKSLSDWKNWVTPDFVVQEGTSVIF